MIVLKLNKPFDPGMYDEGATYQHVLVTTFNMAVLAQVIEIVWEYGTMDAQAGWTAGKASMPQRTVLQNEDFYAAIAAMPAEGASDSILMAAARECYDILASKAQTAGDVVEITVEPETAPEPAAATDDATTSAAAAPRSKKKG